MLHIYQPPCERSSVGAPGTSGPGAALRHPFRVIATGWSLLLCLLSLLLPRMVTAQPGQAAAACPPGLVHYFGLDETTAASAYLDYQSPVKAKCAACPEPVQGLFAGAQKFDGKDDGLDITDIQHFQWGPNSNFTIELWVKTTGSSSSNQVLIGREAEDSQMLWWIGLDTNGYAVFELSLIHI